MKSQMKFQKILTLVTLIVSVLPIVFALIFFTGNLSDMLNYQDSKLAGGRYASYTGIVTGFINAGQTFVGVFLVIGIVFLLSVVLNYLMASNTRRKYYITNYVAIGVLLAAGLVVVIYGIVGLSTTLAEFEGVDWESFRELIEAMQKRGDTTAKLPGEEVTMFIIGYAVLAVVIVDLAAWVLNLVWKVKLMQGEKALLEQGVAKEVA